MSALSVAERVAKGVAWLDVNRAGWPHTVELATFDIGDSCRCVLGQTTPRDEDGFSSGFFDTLNEPGHGEKWVVDHGFDAERDDLDDYDALQAEWTRVIRGRLAAEGTGDPSDGTP